MFYDYYILKMKDVSLQIPEWMKAERYEFCEKYENRVYQETLFSRIRKIFKK